MWLRSGALAVSISDPNVVWAGTGETNIRSMISIGNGIYKSTDAGKTWQHMGLRETGRIGRVVIHPDNPDIVFAAAVGTAYGPQPERGVFRTVDGGETWERVLFVGEDTGASDIAMDPANPRNLVAGMWPIDIKTWQRTSGGPNGGIFVTHDGGDTWERRPRACPSHRPARSRWPTRRATPIASTRSSRPTSTSSRACSGAPTTAVIPGA